MIEINLLQKVFEKLKTRKLKLITAESLTAGMIASEFVKIAGASSVLWGGIICYDTEVKRNILKVQDATIQSYGVVSAETAREMSAGALDFFYRNSQTSTSAISIAVTGVAGPDKQEEKPVGTVHISICFFDKLNDGFCFITKSFLFSGTRQEIREQTVNEAMQIILNERI